MFRNRRSLIALLGVVAVVGSLLVVVPALGNPSPDAVQLILGSNPRFQYGSQVQQISTASNGCQINQAANGGETLINLNPQSNANLRNLPLPGLASDSIGIKSSGSNSNGVPCSQVDGTETLTIQPGSSLSGRSFEKVRLDLEMTGDAVVELTFTNGTWSETYFLQTGKSIDSCPSAPGCEDLDRGTPFYEIETAAGETVSACAAPANSGPNSGGSDNCVWTVTPSQAFTKIDLSVVDIGTVSLEGGTDTAGTYSLFYIANAPPVAVDDSYSTAEDTALTVAVPGVLSNDDDADGDEFTVTSFIPPDSSAGSVEFEDPDNPGEYLPGVAPDGSFRFTPADDFNTPDLNPEDGNADFPVTFTYTIADGNGGTDTATVSITVTPVNDEPVAKSPEVSTDEDTPLILSPSQLGHDPDCDVSLDDPDCEPVTVEIAEPLPANGTAVIDADGDLVYTPNADFNGTDTIVYRVCDSSGCVEQTATVTVSVAAGIDPDVAYIDTPTQPFVLIDVLANDGPGLTINTITQPSEGSAEKVAIDVDANGVISESTGSGYYGIKYTAPLNDESVPELRGSVVFSYTVSDGTTPQGPADITVYELFDCGETLTIDDEELGISASYTRDEAEPCTGKIYDIFTTETDEDTEAVVEGGLPTVVLEPRDPQACGGEGQDPCETAGFSFSFTDRWRPVSENGDQYWGTLEIDPTALGDEIGFTRANECVNAVVEWSIEGNRPVARVTDAEFPNPDVPWCWAVAVTESRVIVVDGVSVSETRTTWFGRGEDDPAKRAS